MYTEITLNSSILRCIVKNVSKQTTLCIIERKILLLDKNDLSIKTSLILSKKSIEMISFLDEHEIMERELDRIVGYAFRVSEFIERSGAC